MARPRISKAVKIKNMLAKGKKVATIAKAVDTTPAYVRTVRWNDKQAA